MPTVQVGYRDLCELVRRELPLNLLQEKLFLMKCEVENVSGDELFLEVTSDRPDLLCSEGIARELRGLIGVETGLAKYPVARGDLIIKVDRSIRQIRPHIAGAIVRGLELTDDSVRQIMQLQEKLHLTYCRNRTKVSVGIHDADTVTHRLVYAGVEPDKIRFTPLDEDKEMNGREVLRLTPKGKEYGWIIEHFSRFPLLYDSEGQVLSMPPIINGVVTQVTPETSAFILDVTGTDLRLVNFVNNIMVTNLAERGGKIESAKIVYDDREIQAPDLRPSTKKLNLPFINQTLGLELKASEVSRLLKRMRYGVKSTSRNRLTAIIPAYRADIMHEVDLVEDLAIAHGYDRLEPAMPMTATIGSERDVTKSTRRIRDLMVGLGYIEVLNYVMTSRQQDSVKMALPMAKVVEIANPLSLDFAVLRSWLLPGLLSFLSSNKHVPYPQRIFECGDAVIIDDIAQTRTAVKRKVAAVICDYRVSYEDIQSSLYSLLRNAGVVDWNLHEVNHPSFIKGRVADVVVSNEKAGFVGEIHPQLLENFGIENPAAAFELDLDLTFKMRKLKAK
jgi:phenylalanyl-tRNA synthetase beta chain